MRKFKGIYYTGVSLSMLVGLWHFTVPWMFGWADYIPYETLTVPICYVNLCFSFLLSGLSLIVLLWGGKVFAGNREAIVLYGFLLLLWIFRVIMTLIYPCPPESNVWMNYGQMAGSAFTMLLLLIPFVKIIWPMRKRRP